LCPRPSSLIRVRTTVVTIRSVDIARGKSYCCIIVVIIIIIVIKNAEAELVVIESRDRQYKHILSFLYTRQTIFAADITVILSARFVRVKNKRINKHTVL